jgi:hypothetical protein
VAKWSKIDDARLRPAILVPGSSGQGSEAMRHRESRTAAPRASSRISMSRSISSSRALSLWISN